MIRFSDICNSQLNRKKEAENFNPWGNYTIKLGMPLTW